MSNEYRPRVYISGPMTGRTKQEIDRAFNNAAILLRSKGYVPVNPTLISELPFSYDEYMEIDLKILSYCDGIYMLSDWQTSFGAQMELQYAIMKQHFVMYEEAFRKEATKDGH